MTRRPPIVTDDAAFFSVSGPYAAVTLVHELRRPREFPFARVGGARWELRLPRPDVDRLEYLLELRGRRGRVERVPDPANPSRVPGPFGDKSVIEFPGYAPPAWLEDEEASPGRLDELVLRSRGLRANVEAVVWTPSGTADDERLPLLLVHDGPEFSRYAELPRLFAHLVAAGEVPPFRAALLPPPPGRSEVYSASARYARALAEEWVPALSPARRPVGLGASLGAVALLHAHWRHPDVLGGLLLQSGTFFRRSLDAHEAAFERFGRISRFVSSVVGGRNPPRRIPLLFTCGTGEENLDNNRVVFDALRRHGWDVELVEHRDAHNWVSWRDVLHPHLAELLLRAT